MQITTKDGQPVSKKTRQAILNQTIFWCDARLCHWFFDFKLEGKWISSVSINNELTKMVVFIF